MKNAYYMTIAVCIIFILLSTQNGLAVSLVTVTVELESSTNASFSYIEFDELYPDSSWMPGPDRILGTMDDYYGESVTPPDPDLLLYEIAFNSIDPLLLPDDTDYNPLMLYWGHAESDTSTGGSYILSEILDVNGLVWYPVPGQDSISLSTIDGMLPVTDFIIENYEYNPPEKPIPEPSTILLFGAGLTGVAGVSRRKKK